MTKGYVRENTQQITAGYSALRKCRNAVSAGVLSPISSAVGRNGAVGDKRNACAGGAAPAASRCCACGRKLGRFVPRHEYLSFVVKRKLPKKTTQTYGLRIPSRRGAKLSPSETNNAVAPLRRRVGFPLTGRRPPAATFLSAKKEMWERKSLRPTV